MTPTHRTASCSEETHKRCTESISLDRPPAFGDVPRFSKVHAPFKSENVAMQNSPVETPPSGSVYLIRGVPVSGRMGWLTPESCSCSWNADRVAGIAISNAHPSVLHLPTQDIELSTAIAPMAATARELKMSTHLSRRLADPMRKTRYEKSSNTTAIKLPAYVSSLVISYLLLLPSISLDQCVAYKPVVAWIRCPPRQPLVQEFQTKSAFPM